MNMAESNEDFAQLWWPYAWIPHFGIPRAWKARYDRHLNLGRPTGPEMDYGGEGRVQHFALGTIIWRYDGTVRVVD